MNVQLQGQDTHEEKTKLHETRPSNQENLNVHSEPLDLNDELKMDICETAFMENTQKATSCLSCGSKESEWWIPNGI